MRVEARDYQELWSALRARADNLAVTREVIDAEAGLPAGYSGTLLAPAQIKKMGLASLGPLLAILGLKLIVVEDGPTPNLVKPSAPHRATPNKPAKAARNQR